MNIQRKEQIFDSIYLFGALPFVFIFARSTMSDEQIQAIVEGRIICFWLLRLFLVRCPSVGSGNSEPLFPDILNRSVAPGKGSSNLR
jgi:hypothetical protein